MYFLQPEFRPLSPPKRIVSLVPSQTELLYHLGLEEQTVGITKFCVHPEPWFRQKMRIGGTKSLDIDKIKALQPDLIIANKEENVKEQVESLIDVAPVWVSDISTLAEALAMIGAIGEITGTREKAVAITETINQGFSGLTAGGKGLNTLYLIWKNPWMSVGNDTFIHDLMTRCGLRNCCGNQQRYPELSEQDILLKKPELVLLSSEPFPFKEKHIASLQTLLPDSRIILVDGEMFSWYGSRLMYAAAYLKQLLEEALP